MPPLPPVPVGHSSAAPSGRASYDKVPVHASGLPGAFEDTDDEGSGDEAADGVRTSKSSLKKFMHKLKKSVSTKDKSAAKPMASPQ